MTGAVCARLALAFGLTGLAGCTARARFGDRAVLWQEPDRAPIGLPASVRAYPDWIGLRDAVQLPAERMLTLDHGREADNVNALDEVPDSTWWTDCRREVDDWGQLRLRALPGPVLERGAMGEALDPRPPFTIVKGKGAGANLGFEVRDALGRRYLFKLDPPGYVGLDTSTEVVVSRLAWAAGYNVPGEVLVDIRPGDLHLSPDATIRNARFDTIEPLSQARLKELLRGAPAAPDGTLRAVASAWIPGRICGPFAYFGRRADDANDRIPHEHRRDLRGFGTFSMWVNNIDALETNTLDAYVGEPGQGHLTHWQQDVGGSFGARAEAPIEWWMGTDTYLAPSRILLSLISLGFYRRPWDPDVDARLRRVQRVSAFPELGNFDWEGFDPRDWHPVLDNPAFERQTVRDRFWAVKRLLAFSEEELRAAIRAGRYRPAAAERLYQILVHRRERIVRAVLPRVAALDGFRFADDRLCFDDLWLAAGLGGAAGTRYLGSGDGVQPAEPEGLGRPCVRLGPGRGYRMVTLRTQRPGERRPGPPVHVHLIEDEGGRRLIGVER